MTSRPEGLDLVETLAKESRAREARMLPAEGPLNADQQEYARRQINAYIQQKGWTLKRAAASIGVGKSTLQFVLNGTYSGDTDKQLRSMFRWMQQDRDKSNSGMPVGFVTTELVTRMLGVIEHVHHTTSMGAIIGPSGTSKSTCVKACAAGLIPGTIFLELAQVIRAPSQLLRALLKAVGLPGHSQGGDQMFARLVAELKGTNRLLAIDEFHFLNHDGAMVVRDLHKQAEIPVVVVGTVDVLKTIDDRDEFRGQYRRLFSMVYDISAELEAQGGKPLYTPEEVVKFASQTMKLRLTNDAIGEIIDFVNLPGWGGLGKLGMVLANAALLAGDNKPIHAKHLRAAMRQMEGHKDWIKIRKLTGKDKPQEVAVA